VEEEEEEEKRRTSHDCGLWRPERCVWKDKRKKKRRLNKQVSIDVKQSEKQIMKEEMWTCSGPPGRRGSLPVLGQCGHYMLPSSQLLWKTQSLSFLLLEWDSYPELHSPRRQPRGWILGGPWVPESTHALLEVLVFISLQQCH
jgi:hypothetical protein